MIGQGGFSTVYEGKKISLNEGLVINRNNGKIYAMKCMKKDKIRREGKMSHVMNERLVLEAVRRTPGKDTCPFLIQMEWAF